jgi:hypothetical protein
VCSKSLKQTVIAITPDVSPPAVQVVVEPIALSLRDAARSVGLPVWTLNEAIMLGSLQAKKGGRQRIILVAELRRWVAALDDITPSSAPSLLARKAARTVDAA